MDIWPELRLGMLDSVEEYGGVSWISLANGQVKVAFAGRADFQHLWPLVLKKCDPSIVEVVD